MAQKIFVPLRQNFDTMSFSSVKMCNFARTWTKKVSKDLRQKGLKTDFDNTPPRTPLIFSSTLGCRVTLQLLPFLIILILYHVCFLFCFPLSLHAFIWARTVFGPPYFISSGHRFLLTLSWYLSI